jgi:hypothetical protein
MIHSIPASKVICHFQFERGSRACRVAGSSDRNRTPCKTNLIMLPVHRYFNPEGALETSTGVASAKLENL